MIKKEQISSPQCCGCCANYGIVKVVMTCDKNFVRSGDVINVSGVIDNSGGTEDITNCHISFQDIRWKISSGGAVRRHVLGNHPLFVIPEPVGKGQTKQFSFSATIPQGLIFSTAIGSILSRFQVLNFTGEIGCCSGGAVCEFLLVFHSGTQQIEVSQKVPPPPGWMPKIAPEVLCTTLPPFHYHPTPGIPYLNRAGTTNITNLNAMTTQEAYFPNKMEGDTYSNVQMY